MPKITALLNPVSAKRVSANIPSGDPLSKHLDITDDVYVECNGVPYHDEVLQDDDVLTLVVVPRGSTEKRKDLARTGIILAAQISAAIATAGMSTWAQLGITAAATAVGSWLAHELIPLPGPPPAPPGPVRSERLGELTGSRNQINPYGIVPRVYGKRKLYPLMSAKPFTEILGNEQYLRLLFVVSAGPLSLNGRTGL